MVVSKWAVTIFFILLTSTFVIYLCYILIVRSGEQFCLESHKSKFFDLRRKAIELPAGTRYITFLEIEDCIKYVNRSSDGREICMKTVGNKSACITSSIPFYFEKKLTPGIYKVEIYFKKIIVKR